MTIAKRLGNALKSYTASKGGNVGILFALSVIPMFLAAGAAIDFARFTAAQSQVQVALDAASLAAAAAPSDISKAKRIQIAEDAFHANLTGGVAGDLEVLPSFDIKDKAVVAHASGVMPTSLMRIGGVDTLALELDAEVNMVSTRKAEIVLVLDYSGSMGDPVKGGTKYKLMSAAAIKLVKDLAKVDDDKVKVGLVPFSKYVHTTLPRRFVADTKGTGDWTGCTQDRGAPHNLSHEEPDGSSESKWAQPDNPEYKNITCSKFTGNGLTVVPLTKDFDKVTSQLSSMRPYGTTHISLGMEFGYHLISKNAPYTEGVEFNDKDTDKYVVVLTDGSQTEVAKGEGGVKSIAQGESNLASLCANLKSNGVKVISMAFDITDDKDPKRAEATKLRLKNCASNPASDYFDANDGADLARAFDRIRVQVSQNIFLNK